MLHGVKQDCNLEKQAAACESKSAPQQAGQLHLNLNRA